MGKVSNRSSLVSSRRRVMKPCPGVGVKKNRGSAKVSQSTPPPVQSYVDEDSGFGGDQSLDSESSLLSAPENRNSGVASITSILPSLAMVPQTVVDNHVSLQNNKLAADFCGEEAQELPESLGCKNSRHVPPLISFRDVSLLSSIGSVRNTNVTGAAPVVHVEGNAQGCRNKKVMRHTVNPINLPNLNAQLSARSSDGSVELMLITQPEEQHRARYQTEGSRGAVKDKDGTGHPTVKLVGYWKPTIVQVFVAEDSVRTSPHMFYQVCRVCGKNSTPCKEKRIDGTAVIEATLDPDSEMIMSCDCVGILKERNVDVEHRFKAVVSRGRKKSTKCRLVFRTFITLPNGTQETLQVVSRPIACTQPPGVPEILRKSLSSCLASGGEDIFIFGKNFSKDTVIIFQETGAKSMPVWEETVIPEKETLQPIHLIVSVPKYYDETITQEVTVQMIISSGNKLSEPHNFTYLPLVPKKEVQGHEMAEDKILPKGVSPGALQVNLHYSETRTLPSIMQEDASSVKISNAPLKMASVPVTKSAVSSVRVPRVVRSSAPHKKIFGRTNHITSQYKAPLVAKKTIVSTAGTNTVKSVPPASSANAGMVEMKQENEEIHPLERAKQDPSKRTVSLGSLVELLNVVQSLPSGSIEDIVKLMKENANPPESSKIVIGQESTNSSLENKVNNNMSLSNVSLQKFQVQSSETGLLVPRDISTNKIMPAVTTNLGLWPLTLFPSITTSQSIAGGPKVARVAPIASTSVVSSPGSGTAVRVCVTEAPHISLEPPKKKARDHMTEMDYDLVERSQLVSDSVVNSVMSGPVATQSSVISYNTETQQANRNVLSNQSETQNPSSNACAPEHPFIHTSSQCVSETSSTLSSSVGNTMNAPQQQQPLYQNVTQSMLQTVNQTTQLLNQPLNPNMHQGPEINQPITVSLGQTLQGVSQPMTVSLNHSSQEVNQPMTVSQGVNHAMAVSQSVNQPMNVSLSHVSQGVSQPMNVSVNHTSQGVNQPMTVSLNHSSQEVNQPIHVSLNNASPGGNQSMSVPMNHTSQAVNQSIAVSMNQNLQEGNLPMNVSCLASAPDMNQVVRQPDPQSIIQHNNSQDINVSSIASVTMSNSLFTQSNDIGTPQMVVAPHAAMSSNNGNQAPALTPQPGVSSAMTHSDPLLSQSVTTMQLNQSGTAAQRIHSSESRPRTDGLMTPTSTATQVSMQNEVTSAINLSETELLNYFDPNCFDNV